MPLSLKFMNYELIIYENTDRPHKGDSFRTFYAIFTRIEFMSIHLAYISEHLDVI